MFEIRYFFTVLNSILIYVITNDIYSNIIQFTIASLREKKDLVASFIHNRLMRATGPVFAFFRCMKNFMQGKKHEIFLRSYDPVHNQADKLNNFIDFIIKEKEKAEGNYNTFSFYFHYRMK